MSTPYERGKHDGQWTDEEIKVTGNSSAQECLEHVESVLLEEIALASIGSTQYEYLQGKLEGTRTSLSNRE